jgi:hypothetical protein
MTLTMIPVLVPPDFMQQLVVDSDASGHRLGVVLMQEKHPITFFSRLVAPHIAPWQHMNGS